MEEDTPTQVDHPDYRQLNYISEFLVQWADKPLEDRYENAANKLFEKIGVDGDSVSQFAVDRGFELYHSGTAIPMLQLLAAAWADGFVMGQIYCTQEYPE